MNVSPLRQGLVGVLFDLNDAAVPGAERRGTVAISRDNGLTWKTTFSAFPGNGGSLGYIAFDSKDENIIYASSVRPVTWNIAGQVMGDTWHHIWKSVDGGNTWVSIDGSAANSNGFPFGVMVYCVKVDPVDNQVVYAGTELGLYYTTNQGLTWARHGTGLPMVAVYDIYVAPDASFMRVGTHGRGVWDTLPPPISIAVSPKTVTMTPGATQAFAATVTGGSGGSGVNWTASAGSITTGGVYTAPLIAGSYTITATSQEDGTKNDRATVTVTSLGTVTIGGDRGVFVGRQATFSAAVSPLTNQDVTWTVSSGAGAIDQQGVFTAPGTAQTVTITAASVFEPLIKASIQVKVSRADFDGNKKTDPQLLGLASAFGSTAAADLDKYDFDNSGRVDNGDLSMLFNEMKWW
jgi:hypothetical protein